MGEEKTKTNEAKQSWKWIKAKTDEDGDERKRNVGQCALRFLFFVFLSFFLPAHFTQYHDWSSGGAAKIPTQGLKETEREIDESQLQDKPEWYRSVWWTTQLMCQVCIFYLILHKFKMEKARLLYMKILDRSHHQNISFYLERDTICSVCVCVFLIFKRSAWKRWFPKSFTVLPDNLGLVWVFLIGTSSYSLCLRCVWLLKLHERELV